MRRTMIIKGWRLTLSLMLSLAPAVPTLADAAVDAKRAYSSRDYNKAAALFESQIKKNPRDAMLHYYYANCLVGKHDNSEAAGEYAIAGQLFKDPKMKDYCMNLAEHFQYHPPAAVDPQLVAPNIPEKILNANRTDDPAKNARIQAILRKGEADASRRINTAEGQIVPLRKEEGDLQSWGAARNRAGTPNMNTEDMLDANQRIDNRAQELRDLAARQAKDIREQAKKDAQRIAN